MIPYSFQSIDKKDIKEVVKALKSFWLTTGPRIKLFEEKLAKKLGVKYVVVVSNGTAALHLAVLAANLLKNSEGITTPISFVASSNAMIYCGIKPIFADIDKRTYNINPSEIHKKVNKKTKLILPVHFAGQPCDMEKIHKLIKGKKITIIEDAAHALGSKYKNGKMVGSCCYSDMTTLSFHPVKNITTGEGGAITTNSKTLYEKLLLLRTHGITKDLIELKKKIGPWYYEMQELGFNYRLTDIQAALGISQLNKLNKFVEQRRKIVKIYNKSFKKIPWLTIPYEENKVYSAFHLYVLLIDFRRIKKTRKQIVFKLQKNGIGTQVHYIPIYKQPYYKNNFFTNETKFPETEKYYDNCLSIPLFPTMTMAEMKKVIQSIKNLHKL